MAILKQQVQILSGNTLNNVSEALYSFLGILINPQYEIELQQPIRPDMDFIIIITYFEQD